MAEQAKTDPRPSAFEGDPPKVRPERVIDRAIERTETSAAALGAQMAEAGDQAARTGAQVARAAENAAGTLMNTAIAETQDLLDAATRLNGLAYRSFQSMASVWTDYLRGELASTRIWGMPRDAAAQPEPVDPAGRAKRLFDASAQIVQISSDTLGEAATLLRETSRKAIDHARPHA